MQNSEFKIGDLVIATGNHTYAGKVAEVRDATDFGHVIVYTVGVRSENAITTFAVRGSELIRA